MQALWYALSLYPDSAGLPVPALPALRQPVCLYRGGVLASVRRLEVVYPKARDPYQEMKQLLPDNGVPETKEDVMDDDTKSERRYEPTVDRIYRNEFIEVTWEPAYCNHFGACFRGAPMVFQPARRPWVDVDASTPDRISQVVSGCPTGALHFRPFDAGVSESATSPPVVEPQADGPLFVRGTIRVAEEGGAVVREDYRVALCRCGTSRNLPFCDGSHRMHHE